MNILFLSQLLPYPLDSGVKFRMYYTLRQLAQSHRVTLLCFIRPDNTSYEIDHLRQYCQAVYTVPIQRSRLHDLGFLTKSVFTGQSFIIARDTRREMQVMLDRLVQQAAAQGQAFDAIHSDQLWMAQYAIRVGGVKKLLDQHNAVYLIPKRMIELERNPLKRLFLELEWRKLARYEAQTCRKFDHLLTVTEVDAHLLKQLMGEQSPPVSVAPICLDGQASPLIQRRPNPTLALHLGTMYWPPNIDAVLWFAEQVFPLLRQQVPHAQFAVVGKNPPPQVQALAAQPGIQVTGYVDDPLPYQQACAAFVAPVRAGGGMRVKIIDAWMRGLPIVSTTIGAEGIAIQPGENILIADDAPSFAAAVAKLILEPEFGRRLAANGRAWAEAKYNWRTVYPALDQIYAAL